MAIMNLNLNQYLGHPDDPLRLVDGRRWRSKEDVVTYRSWIFNSTLINGHNVQERKLVVTPKRALIGQPLRIRVQINHSQINLRQ
jgi:hypothetical protein